MRITKAYLHIVILLFYFSGIQAQEYLFDAQHLTTNDGLANLRTNAVYKDSKGFMWISTGHGLNRYDGYSFRLYTRETAGLKKNGEIRQIKEDEQGNLWLFYRINSSNKLNGKIEDDIDVFNPKTGQVIPFDIYFEKIKPPFQHSEINLTKTTDPKKRIWITTKKGQVFIYQDGVFEKVFEQKDLLFDHLVVDKEEQLWLGSQNQILHINPEGKVLETLELPYELFDMWIDENDKLWLSTVEHPGDKKQKTIIYSKASDDSDLRLFTLSRDGRILSNVNRAIRTSKGFWYANKEDHFYLFNSKGEHLFDFHTLLTYEMRSGFSNYFETDKQVWFTSPGGVLKTKVETNPFELIHKREELSDCRSITADEKGNIYFLNSAIYYWDSQKKNCKKLDGLQGSIGLIYSDSVLWTGAYSGLFLGRQHDLRTETTTIYKGLGYGGIKTSLQTASKNIFLTGHEKGLAYIDLESKKHLPFQGYNGFEQLKTATVNYLYRNQKGIWIASELGVFLMDEQRQMIIRHFDKASGDLSFNHIRHINEDKKGVFWLATKGGGIIRWEVSIEEGEPSKTRTFTTENGLSHNYTYAVYSDDYEHLWIPSDRGLMCMNTTTFEVKTYLKEDGLPHNEFNLTAHHQSKDGRLYFGGLGGLITFHPDDFKEKDTNQTPLEFISYFLLEKGAEKTTDKTNLLRVTKEVVIRPTDKLFELQFTLLDFDNPESHAYKYKIEGYTDYWTHINDNYIRITNLPAGNYTLKIKGKNNSIGWSEAELTLLIRVLKPFYLQWWFIGSLLLFGFGLAIITVRKREFNLQKDRDRLEIEVQKRTLTIQQQADELKALDEAKTRFFSNVTHEFRTPLTLILGPLEQVISDPPPSNILRKRLSSVLKNAYHLLGLINQMLDLSKIEGGRMNVELTQGDIIEYTQDLIKRFHSYAHKKEQRLSFVSKHNKWETNFDKNKWDKIIYNLLSNALKFTPKGNAIQLSLNKGLKGKKEYIRLDVKDTGVGIKKSQVGQIFNRFYQADGSATRTQDGTGIGLALVKELIELQGGEIWVTSEVNKGTSFQIEIPVMQAEALAPLLQSTTDTLIPPFINVSERMPLTRIHTKEEKHKLDILIIEDNEEIREYIRYCIDTSKYNIFEANDGEEGIQKAQALIPDLIISDVMMPKKDGFEVTRTIRNHVNTSHIPLILLTAKSSLESRLQGLQQGADAYLTKPFSPQELAVRVQKLIEIRQALQQRYRGGEIFNKEESFQQEDAFITNLREYILQHIDESKLNGDRIGKHFAMSRVHLHRKLKALTNLSTSEFIRSIRLKKAKELIQEGKFNVTEIAWQTGFSSSSHFSRSFKTAFGKAPSQMRQPNKI